MATDPIAATVALGGKNKAACRLHALLLDLIPGGVTAQMTVTRANAMPNTIETPDAMACHRVELGRELVADVARLEARMETSSQRIRTAVAASGMSLTEVYGCEPICAAMIIGHTGDISRFESRDHVASYNATAPNEASSGPRPRHRSTRAATGNGTGRST